MHGVAIHAQSASGNEIVETVSVDAFVSNASNEDESIQLDAIETIASTEGVNNMIKVIDGDITTLAVDAIVNAANCMMLGGGGVDGAIHWAAGDELFEACLKVPEVKPGVRCPTGEARITPGFKLPAKFVIHTVGPVYYGGEKGEPEKLANCYRNSLALAAENNLKTVAFPCISTGVYGYPIEDAAEIAIRETKTFLTTHPDMEVTFCCFSPRDKAVYDKLLGR